MSNAPGPRGQGRSRRRPTPTSGPRGRPDAPRRRAPAAASAGVPEPASPGGGARSLGQDSRPGPRAPRPHLHLPRPPLQAGSRAAGARAPRGAVLRAPGLSLPRPHSPDQPTAAAAGAQGRVQNRTQRAPKESQAEENGGPTPLHSAAAGALPGGAAAGAWDCACAGSGAGSRERSGPAEGRRGWDGAGRAWGRWGRRAPAPPGDSRGFSRCPARAPGASAGGFLGNRASWR